MTYKIFKEIVLDRFNRHEDMVTFRLVDLNQVVVEVDRQLEYLESLTHVNLDKT